MLNYIWGYMILVGIAISAFSGKISTITNVTLDSCKDSINLCIQMLGIISLWSGIMNIAEKSGLIDSLSRKLNPILKLLFSDIPKNSKAIKYISTNLIANMLGLGWAATPTGLMAMKELQKLNKNKNIASKSMCMFLILNMSSLQLISINVISDRSLFKSSNPSEVILPAFLTTVITAIVGILIGKLLERFCK